MSENSLANKKPGKTTRSFLLLSISIVFILPLLSVAFEEIAKGTTTSWQLIGKWFIFWVLGIQLFTIGIRQASDPASEALKIFKLNGKNVYVIIRRLGFANISLGILGILSLINNHWRQIGAISGISFFGFAVLQNLSQKVKTRNEIIAVISDILTSVVMLLYLLFTF